MFLTGAIERYGTGIPEMYALTAEMGLKEPDFDDNKTFSVTLWRPSARTDHDTGQVTGHVTGQVTGQVEYLDELSEASRVVIVLEGERKRDEIMSVLELKHRDNFMDNYLNPALAKGWVERTIPDKPTSSKQKYRLTQSGMEHKSKIKDERK